MKHRVVVAGGDARDAWLCRFLAGQEFHVECWGMTIAEIEPFKPQRQGPDILIGPMTGIGPRGSMETIEGSQSITPQLLAKMPEGGIVAAGLVAADVRTWAQELGLMTVEYRKQPIFMWLNAVPTAEGALKAALGRSGFTVYHRSFAILGFGRVGSVLALRLQSYGASPEIFERSEERRAMASAYGFRVHALDPQWCPPVDGIFNTIPHPVLTPEWFDLTDPAWIVDLASKPGGLSFHLYDKPEYSARYESILGIPGQVAPRRAAEIIWETLSVAISDCEFNPVVKAQERRT